MISEMDLLKKAFYRTKERFSIYTCFFAIYIMSVLLFGLNIFMIYAFPKAPYLIFAPIFFLGGFVLYLFAIFAMVVVLIDEQKLTFRDGLKKSTSYFRGYIWFSLFSGLFLFGLFPLGIASMFIVLILWSLWSVFSLFIYIEKRKKGLENLWISRMMVQRQFWYVVKNVLLVGVPALMLAFGISFFYKSGLVQFITSFFYGIVLYPFMASFFYELYKTLPEPEHVKTPKVWLILSGIGWIIIVCVLFITLLFPNFLPVPSTRPCVNTETTRCLTS